MKNRKLFYLLIFISSFIFVQRTAVETKSPPKIDGVIEKLWHAAEPFTSFTQIEPEIKAKPTVKTDAYLPCNETVSKQNVHSLEPR